jgi:hypothetical protein
MMSKRTIVGRVYNEPKRSVNREEVVSKRKVGMTNNALKRPAGNARIGKPIVGVINNELPKQTDDVQTQESQIVGRVYNEKEDVPPK